MPLQKFTPEEHGGGLASLNITEDPHGQIYVANEKGTLCYNGADWQILPQTGYSPFTSAVHIDRQGRIWVGGVDHLGYYASDNSGQPQFIDQTQELLQTLQGAEYTMVWDIVSDKQTLYIITSFQVLWNSGTGWQVHQFNVQRRILPTWLDGQLYVHARESGLFRIKAERIEKILDEREEFSRGIISVLSAQDSDYLLATIYNGIWRIKDDKLEPVTDNPLIDQGNIAATRTDDGSIVMGQPSGVHLVTSDYKTVKNVNETRDWLQRLYTSSGASIWGATKQSILNIPILPYSRFGHPSYNLTKHNDVLYISDSQNLKKLQLRPQTKPIVTIASGWISNVIKIGAHTIFSKDRKLNILLRGQPFQVIDIPRPYDFLVRSLLNDRIFYTLESPELSRWQINEQSSTIRLNQTDRSKKAFCALAEIDKATSLYSTFNNEVGLIHWPPLDEVGRAPELEVFEGEYGLPEQRLWTRCLQVGERAILASDKGLFAYNAKQKTFSNIEVLGNAFGKTWNDLIHCSSSDSESIVLYVPSGAEPSGYCFGILNLDEVGEAQWRPLQLPGLPDVGTVRSLLHEERDGREILWVGGTKDLFRYDITDLETPPALRVNLTSIKEATGNTTLYGGFGPLPNTTNWAYPQKSLKLQFAAPPAALKAKGYQSRLVGFDDDWSELSELPFREYSNLHEGKYTFEVRAIDEFGRPGPPASFAFTLLPPWYRTPHAYVGYVALVICILLIITRLWTQHLRQRNLELEATVEQRTGELKRSNLELREANAVKQDFLASMSHEIRNPLNGILGIAQLLKEEKHGDPTRVNHLNACATHLHQLLGQVLDFSSIESGRLEIRPMPFDVSQLIKDVIGMHLVLAEKKGLELHEQISHTDYLWIGDPTLLKQVLINLVSNAIKYTPSGEVRVRLDFTKSNARIRAKFAIEDTGPGIPRDKEDYIFKDFTRLNKAGESEVAGTGLGLAIASQMTELMKGTLRVDPDYTEGARFVLELPFDTGEQKTAQARTRGSITNQPLTGKTVLIADDMDFNRYICRELLEKLGAEVSEAEDGLAALDKLQNSNYTMAILDINMPNMDGNAVLKNYLAQLVGEPPLFIALTAHVNAEMERTALEAGFKHFIEKPLEPEQLFQIIQKEVLRKKPDMAKDLLSYLSGGDSASKAKLKERYMRSVREQVESLSKSIESGNLEESPDILHKLRGLVNFQRKTNALKALDKLSAMLQADAPLPDLLTACQKLQDTLDGD